MKKISLIIIGAAVVAGFFFLRPTEIINYPSAGTDVIAFGDSLTAGVGSSRGEGFVKMITDDIDLPIINLGVSGDTTEAALNRVMQLDNYDPKIVILLLGGNDYLAGVPKEKTLENLAKIIDEIHKRGAVVLLLGLDEAYEDLAEEKKSAYVPDILGGIFGKEALMSDGLHPNDRGYKMMAERVKPALKELID
ncbi:MAG: hypothetical protein A2758_02345 [Candidatus Zambryskibacteria bacterium RIFCSPHIGHO2_01_FULL_49_18]|uniref:SGNH hydrolase-type esterase domain-containing protein n=2 Tax=Candidatus Zambryskiibacteriota TaxID=1817925 RepID=A0A1G2T2C2_9BACT|nr:MAG: hypothetical protein A2758_02345 [Candidatus Zambryskibacteria bacterium RIFCSPHIGHO2_01_FULL_49_18]OHB06163.1 MAG: hypothetical protein A3A26_01305 [Candidatus Zambryskibacteria bacterium RIFCSPLOWO2_01_FULL_47_14]